MSQFLDFGLQQSHKHRIAEFEKQLAERDATIAAMATAIREYLTHFRCAFSRPCGDCDTCKLEGTLSSDVGRDWEAKVRADERGRLLNLEPLPGGRYLRLVAAHDSIWNEAVENCAAWLDAKGCGPGDGDRIRKLKRKVKP